LLLHVPNSHLISFIGTEILGERNFYYVSKERASALPSLVEEKRRLSNYRKKWKTIPPSNYGSFILYHRSAPS
jgi:hypothetical protein